MCYVPRRLKSARGELGVVYESGDCIYYRSKGVAVRVVSKVVSTDSLTGRGYSIEIKRDGKWVVLRAVFDRWSAKGIALDYFLARVR